MTGSSMKKNSAASTISGTKATTDRKQNKTKQNKKEKRQRKKKKKSQTQMVSDKEKWVEASKALLTDDEQALVEVDFGDTRQRVPRNCRHTNSDFQNK